MDEFPKQEAKEIMEPQQGTLARKNNRKLWQEPLKLQTHPNLTTPPVSPNYNWGKTD